MTSTSLFSCTEVQQQLADYLKARRRTAKLSRRALAERSTVPATTLRKFEDTGQISLRQFVLLWQTLDSLERLQALTRPQAAAPSSIDEVLSS